MNAVNRIGTAGSGVALPGKGLAQGGAPGVKFGDVLADKMKDITFSAHAQTRVKSRNIDVSAQVMDKLGKAVETAEKKGSRNSLVLFPNAAFIVNIPNKTVVTAMDGENIRENIFTNIDSTVLAG